MGITGNKKLTGIASSVAIVGSLFGLTVASCSDSGDKTPAALGGKVIYEYTLPSAKTELPAGVSYIAYTGYDKDGQAIYSKAKGKIAQTVTLVNVPEGTTRMDAIYYDGNNNQVAFGVNTFASVSKGTETTVSTPSYVAVADLPTAMSVVVEPSEEIIGVDDTVAYNVYRLFDNGVDQDPIKDKLALALKSGDAAVADFAQGAEPNVITGLAFGETEVGLADAYMFMEQAIPTTAAKLTVLDGELQSVEVKAANDKAIYSEDSSELYIVNNYINESTENTWAKKYVEEYKLGDKNYELQSSQMKVIATYLVEGKEKTADVTKNAAFKLANTPIIGAPFALDAKVNGLVTVASTANTASKETLTATYKDILDGKTEKDDTLVLAAAATKVILTVYVAANPDPISTLELEVNKPKELSDVKAMPQVITPVDTVNLKSEPVSVKDNDKLKLSVLPATAVNKVGVNGLKLTATSAITEDTYLLVDLEGNTNIIDNNPTPDSEPTGTPTALPTPTPTRTPAPSPTSTSIPTPSPTPTPTPTPTPSTTTSVVITTVL